MGVVQGVLSLPDDILKVFGLFQDAFMSLPFEVRAIMIICLTIVSLFGIVKALS
jgi:hypothetical protein